MTWQTKKLSVLCDLFADGDWIEKKDQSQDGIRLIQTGNIGSGYFKDRGEKARYISEKTFNRLNCTEILPKDCLVSRLPDPVGRACIIPETGEKMITAVDCTIIRFKNELLPQWFVNYSLSHEYQNQINKEVGGATRQRISRANLGQIEIPLPTLVEQKRIVKKLDEVFEKVSEAKENAEKNLQNSKELFESYLQNVFAKPGKDWEEQSLSNVCEVEYGYTEKAKSKGDYRFVRITDTDENGLLTQENKMYVGSFGGDSKYILSDGDLLMARTGASAGNVLFFESDEKAIFASYLIRLKFRKEVSSKLYWFFSKSKLYWDQVKQLSAGSAQPQFNGGALKKIIFPFPKSLHEQKAIVKKLDALLVETKKLEKIYEHKLANLEELKKSVLSKAFNAEL